MRSVARACAAAAIAFAVVACGDPGMNAPADDVLYVSAGSGVAAVDTSAEERPSIHRSALPSGDWSTVITTKTGNGTTEIIATDPDSGDVRWRDVVAGTLVANIVSHDGDLVALSPKREAYYGSGRTQTEFVIAGRELVVEHRITVLGNFEPEAFSTDGSNLFVIKYIPARSPSKYQVRHLDLATGQVHEVFTPDAELQRAMGGTARIQAASPDGNRLYTLYTLKDEGPDHVFVHVLDLNELWAHCVDLPHEFAQAAHSSTALAVAPDNRHVYVVNTDTEKVAEIDTETLAVTRTGSFDLPTTSRDAYAATDGVEMLYVGSGPWVVALDLATFAEVKMWTMDDTITGLQASTAPGSVYVGLRAEIVKLDLVEEVRRTIESPGLRRIKRLGPVQQPPTEEEKDPIVKCAC